jgi:hypothetical protein
MEDRGRSMILSQKVLRSRNDLELSHFSYPSLVGSTVLVLYESDEYDFSLVLVERTVTCVSSSALERQSIEMHPYVFRAAVSDR